MTVTITQNVHDIGGVADTAPWRFSSVLREGSDDNSIVTGRVVTVTPVAGVLTVELDPGPAIVSVGERMFSFTVPETDSDLWSLIEVGLAVPVDTSAQLLASAIHAYLEAHPIPIVVDSGGYSHTQASASATWTIAHPIGRKPASVTVWIDDELVEGDVEAPTTAVVVITFPFPVSGRAEIL